MNFMAKNFNLLPHLFKCLTWRSYQLLRLYSHDRWMNDYDTLVQWH
jgi:hypothetical protein